MQVGCSKDVSRKVGGCVSGILRYVSNRCHEDVVIGYVRGIEKKGCVFL